MSRLILGITGAAGSGKSTAAEEIVSKLGFVRVRFAGPLKAMARVLGLSWEQIDGKLKETPCDLLGGNTPRHAMQTLGTEWGRNCIHPNLWVNAWKHEVNQPAFSHKPIVADDVRFRNELDAIRDMGGVVLHIDRPGVTPVGNHISEAFSYGNHVLTTDLRINNNVPLEEFLHEVRAKINPIVRALTRQAA